MHDMYLLISIFKSMYFSVSHNNNNNFVGMPNMNGFRYVSEVGRASGEGGMAESKSIKHAKHIFSAIFSNLN